MSACVSVLEDPASLWKERNLSLIVVLSAADDAKLREDVIDSAKRMTVDGRRPNRGSCRESIILVFGAAALVFFVTSSMAV